MQLQLGFNSLTGLSNQNEDLSTRCMNMHFTPSVGSMFARNLIVHLLGAERHFSKKRSCDRGLLKAYLLGAARAGSDSNIPPVETLLQPYAK